MVVPVRYHCLCVDICGTTIDSTISTHTTYKPTGAGLNRNCTGNPLTIGSKK